MATKDSTENDPTRSDYNMAHKRMKTDHANNQLSQFSISNNSYSITEQTITDHTEALQTTVLQKHPTIVKAPTSYLERLPNELFLHIFSYMTQPDIVHAFFGLNQRFDSLTFESVRQFQVVDDTPLTWFNGYMARIENAIEIISLSIKSIPNVFLCNHSYSHLRSIILKQEFNFNVQLNVENCSGLSAIISCLNLLQTFSTWRTEDCEIAPLFETDPVEHTSDTQMDLFFNTSLCPAVERLSAYVWGTQDWICLCGRTPNLTYLQIIYDKIQGYEDNLYPTPITSPICGPSHLTDLHIVFGYNQVPYESIEWLISYCQSSLKRFTLSAKSSQIGGKRLETLLQPCRKLTKLAFDIEFTSNEIDMMEMLRQFQTDWWLDVCRPPVFLQHDNSGCILIATMPCTSLRGIKLNADLNTWLVNKEQLDSPLIYFSKVTGIHISNSSQQPVTLDLLRLIARMFHSPHQCLNFKFWGFHQPQILYEQLSNSTAIIPRLHHVTNLYLNTAAYAGFDATSLVTWLVIVPNVKKLNLIYMPYNAKFQLAKDLDRMLEIDQNLTLVFSRIEEMAIFSFHSKTNEPTKREAFFLFSKIFPKADVHEL